VFHCATVHTGKLSYGEDGGGQSLPIDDWVYLSNCHSCRWSMSWWLWYPYECNSPFAMQVSGVMVFATKGILPQSGTGM